MKYILLLLCALAFPCYAAVKDSEKKQSAAQDKIELSIKLLEEDKVKLFLQGLIHPEEKVKEDIVIDEEFIQFFRERKKDQLLEILKTISKQQPVSETEFAVSYKLGKGKFLNFLLYQGEWYLSNDDDKVRKK